LHFYPKVVAARVHPVVGEFMGLRQQDMAAIWHAAHASAEPGTALALLHRVPRRFRWGGSDLVHVVDESLGRSLVVLETNSCPSGQKSMPRLDPQQPQGGYRRLLEAAFLPMVEEAGPGDGGLAVLFDKNLMGNSGYAAALADISGEPVHLVPWFEDDPEPPARVREDGTIEVRPAGESGDWVPIRAALRYVTQRPWTRLPAVSRTVLMNPVLVCLAGGRNKTTAARAYERFNMRWAGRGLRIATPRTLCDVAWEEVAERVARMGGLAVVKVPYANAGQGIWTITGPRELQAFLDSPRRYERLLVQQLIGGEQWGGDAPRLRHVGTTPDAQGRRFAVDLRVMVGAAPSGFFPVALYARRARLPLPAQPDPDTGSWEVLGTNLSKRLPDGSWDSETERLLLVDEREWDRLGLGLPELVEAYVQTVACLVAIDELADSLLGPGGRLVRTRLFAQNADAALLSEVADPGEPELRGAGDIEAQR
jgi:hypothetical protein